MTRSYKLDELARAADLAPRTVRYYVQRGLLPAPVFHGKDTAYDDDHLLRLRAIKRLQAGHLPLDVIQGRIAGASAHELERIAAGAVVEVHVPSVPPPRTAPRAPHAPLEAWSRVELLPGVELFVKADAGPAAQRLAREILDAHAPRSPRS